MITDTIVEVGVGGMYYYVYSQDPSDHPRFFFFHQSCLVDVHLSLQQFASEV